MRNHVKLPSIQNVVAGQRCDLQLGRGLTFDYILFKLTNVTVADITNFKVKVGTKSIIDISKLEYLDEINKHNKRPETAGYFTLWFYRPEMATEEERSMYCMGTSDIPSLNIHFDLAGTVVNPAIEAYAMQRGPEEMGIVTKYRELPANFASSGQQVISSIPRTGDMISAIHMFKSDVSNVELEMNLGTGPAKIIEMPKDVIEVVQKSHGRDPRTEKATHIDSMLLGHFVEGLPTDPNLVQELTLKPTIDTAGTINNVIEFIGGIDGA